MISIIIPLYNEEESLPYFYKELSDVLKKNNETYEIIFIDDGSVDTSLAILKEIASKDKNIKIFSFRKNQGKSEALMFGFRKAKGEYIATLDADLQDKPLEISRLLEKAKEGWDLVCGWRKNRQDPSGKIFSSRIFNRLVGMLWGLELHDYNCGLKLYTQEAAKSLRIYGGLHRFIPLFIYQQGFLVCEVPVVHEKRRFGISKFGFSKLWKDLPDIFTMLFLTKYKERPLHFFGTVGGILFLIGFIILSYLSILHFQGETIGRRPLLFLGMLLILSGFQVLFTGFLADLIISFSYRNRKLSQDDENIMLKYESSRGRKE